jgi:hypothetical protein
MMENTADNRKLVATWAIESFTGGEAERVADFLLKEVCARYKREPGLFDSLVETMEDDEAHAKWKAEQDDLWEGHVPKPDKEQ